MKKKTENLINLNEIIQLGTELNSINDLDILLEKILLESRKVVGADAGSIYIREGDVLIFSHSQNNTQQAKLSPGKKLIYTTFKVNIDQKSIAGYVASTGKLLNIVDVYNMPSDAPYQFNSRYDELTKYKTTSVLTVPMKTADEEVIGVLQVINSISDGEVVPFSSDSEPLIIHFANSASLAVQRARMTRALLLRMIGMAELRDPKETGAHVNRVATYSMEIYEKWAFHKGIPKAEVDKNRDVLRMASMLHDVGKVAISDLILKKPAKFTEEEYEIIKTHTYLGARLFRDRQSKLDEVAALIALTHHENWDGTGYPGHVDVETGKALETTGGKATGRKGEEIPVFGRIVALADVYDALSSRRVYKSAWEEKDVLEEIKKLSGTKFDPDLVDVFFDTIDLIRSIRERYPDSH